MATLGGGCSIGRLGRRALPKLFRQRLAPTGSSRAYSVPSVRILEVGPRDGLQNIKTTVPTATKVELIRRLHQTGLNHIETTSFVAPKWIPQLADNREVFAKAIELTRNRPIDLPVLVPNMKGFEMASDAQAKTIEVFASASEGFSWKNTNCSVDEALKRAESVTKVAIGNGMRVRGVVSCIFDCPYDGPTDPSAVARVVRQFLDMGCYEIGLGDTVGVGTPADVNRLLSVLAAEGISSTQLAGHFHDTYGQAVANMVAAFDRGIQAFDSSVAGLGGCPYAKGARGNAATEDLVYTLERAGVSTGIDLQMLAEVGDWITQELKLPNGSRAGAALVAKQRSRQQSAQNQDTSASPKQSPDTLDWQQIEDTGEYIVARRKNAVKIKLTRPKNGNALTTSMVTGITNLFKTLALDSSCFHIVLEAEGKFFCTGMDLSSSGSTVESSEVKADYYQKVVDFFGAIQNAPQTTIAKIDGPAFGGGVGLAFSCDIRLATSQAAFTMTEIKLGLTPAIISKFLVKEWGVSFLREAMLTGRTVPSHELKQLGIVHGVAETTDDLKSLTDDYLHRLAKCAPRSAAACKRLINRGWQDAGSAELDNDIQEVFAKMMDAGSEGEHGLDRFRKKVKGIDWGAFHAESTAR